MPDHHNYFDPYLKESLLTGLGYMPIAIGLELQKDLCGYISEIVLKLFGKDTNCPD